MDGARFDALTRTLRSRRTALGTLLRGSLAALLGLAEPEEAAAHNRFAACRQLPDPASRRRCLRRAQAHRQRCHTAAARYRICAGRCRTVRQLCGRAITCTCPATHACLPNGTCARDCKASGSGVCPPGCVCGTAHGADYPVVACLGRTTCDQIPQECASTAECPVGYVCERTGCPGNRPFPYRCAPVC